MENDRHYTQAAVGAVLLGADILALRTCYQTRRFGQAKTGSMLYHRLHAGSPAGILKQHAKQSSRW